MVTLLLIVSGWPIHMISHGSHHVTFVRTTQLGYHRLGLIQPHHPGSQFTDLYVWWNSSQSPFSHLPSCHTTHRSLTFLAVSSPFYPVFIDQVDLLDSDVAGLGISRSRLSSMPCSWTGRVVTKQGQDFIAHSLGISSNEDYIVHISSNWKETCAIETDLYSELNCITVIIWQLK